MSGLLNLEVSVPADEWAYMKRRVTYLEALLLRIVRDGEKMREWFIAAEFAGMLLPGLPDTTEGISRKAAKEKWMKRRTKIRGRWFYAYHVSSLPERSFDAMLAQLMDLPPIDALVPLPDLMPPRPELPQRIDDGSMAPPWVLPLMRIMKRETGGNLGAAWEILPERLSPDIVLPSVEDAATILVGLGIVGNG